MTFGLYDTFANPQGCFVNVFPLISGGKVLRPPGRVHATFPPNIKGKTLLRWRIYSTNLSQRKTPATIWPNEKTSDGDTGGANDRGGGSGDDDGVGHEESLFLSLFSSFSERLNRRTILWISYEYPPLGASI